MAPNACTYCNKPSTTNQPLKPCNSCKAVAYCDRKCQQAHFKAHKKICREQKIAEDHAARDQVAMEKAAKDAYAEQLAAEYLVSVPTEADQQPRVMCYVDNNGAAVSRTLDGNDHVQPAYTYVLRYIQPAAEAERGESQYRAFTPAMMAAMEHLTESQKAAYHSRVQEAMIKEWVELDKDPQVLAQWTEEERKKVHRFARKCMAEEKTKCLHEGS